MRKLMNYIKVNSWKNKISYFIIGALIIFNLLGFKEFIGEGNHINKNWYDLIISILSNYLNIAYVFFILFMLYIHNIMSRKNFYKYIFLKLKSRTQWYYYNVFLIIAASLTFTAIIVIINILEGIFTMPFTNEWSNYSISLSNNPTVYLYDPKVLGYVIKIMSPLKYVAINIVYLICFFITIGLIYLIFSMILKNNIRAFVTVFIINCINIVFYNKISIPYVEKFSFYYNIILLSPCYEELNRTMIYSRLIYWVLLISALIIIGNVIKGTIDMNFGDDS